MKPYKFLIPVGIAASALSGTAAKASVEIQPSTDAVHAADAATVTSTPQAFARKYVTNGEEHTLLLRISGGGVLYSQHGSHSSHSSHTSHSSHSSHSSGS
jgi:hypothetical protein